MPISSPKMTSMLGLRPAAGAAGAGVAGAAAGAAFWACANACDVSVAAATIDDEPSNTARRSMAALSPPLESVAVWSRFLASLLILRSLATRGYTFYRSGFCAVLDLSRHAPFIGPASCPRRRTRWRDRPGSAVRVSAFCRRALDGGAIFVGRRSRGAAVDV